MRGRVISLGSINMDLVARVRRHPAPGETLAGESFATYPGGKGANQAIAASRLGADTRMVGRVGVDAFGEELLHYLERQGVDVQSVSRHPRQPTGTAMIVVDEAGENTIVVVPGANGQLDVADVERSVLGDGDVLVAQFEIPLATIEAGFARCRGGGGVTVLNPAPAQACRTSLLGLTDVLVLNETELSTMLNDPPAGVWTQEGAVDGARRLRTNDAQTVVVTLGAAGAVAISGDRVVRAEGRSVNVVDTTAAGDTFVGALAAELAHGRDLEPALRFANVAASLCVQRSGAGPSIPDLGEVRAEIGDAS